MIKEEKSEEIATYTSKCPVCSRELTVKDYKYSVPFYGDIIISVAQCNNCGYRHRDVFTLSSGEPRKVIYKVEEPGDDNALLIKSSTCKIEIPEFGASIEPGTYSQGYISTVEGLISDLIEITDYLCNQENAPKEKCQEIKTMLEKARENKVSYTVIIYDHLGICDIVSSHKKPIYEKLN
ncbi:MAG: ZPR1 zinc finger domain-containing protein [Desulfurococcaceae archaeon]